MDEVSAGGMKGSRKKKARLLQEGDYVVSLFIRGVKLTTAYTAPDPRP